MRGAMVKWHQPATPAAIVCSLTSASLRNPLMGEIRPTPLCDRPGHRRHRVSEAEETEDKDRVFPWILPGESARGSRSRPPAAPQGVRGGPDSVAAST